MRHLTKIIDKDFKLKIDNSIHSVSNVSGGDGKKRPENASASGINPENTSNTVHISAQAINLKSSERISSNDAVVDMSRVQEIKSAISEGTFKVNPDVVADRLLETVKELINTKEDRS
ncbi:anti-sigma-28 factor, FlgM family [Nitrosomonas marina]|uniref:Negative regulator of flagellin synthesis n=1 Tax=Nitrosomonas marina TaxID=917 RepID=A0A1I0CJQ0_9PROT|nr:anti-sigma-28 factor, FlgM family [Nitrosomonas marina]